MPLEIIIIDDNIGVANDALIWELKEKFGNDHVHLFHQPDEGLNYIKDHLDNNQIVLLDIDFPQNEKNGHELLKEITTTSQLIPVILWSGIDENAETFSDFINNHAFGFISKMGSTAEALNIIDNAIDFFLTSLDNTIEDWIISNKGDKDKPIYFTSAGQSYSLNNILKEIRHQTPIGKEFSKKLNALTIDLLLRDKEKL